MNPQTTTEIAVRPNGSEVVRQEFGAVQTQQVHETAAVAVAAREKAATEARYIVARHNPRNIEQFRTNLLHACQRPTFAEKVEYGKPIGKEFDETSGKWVEKKAYGPSIRFIETALQAYGNVYPEVTTVYDSAAARICRVSVTGLESNITYTTEVMIQKAVERKGNKQRNGEWEPPKGRIVISERLNSYGDKTYLVMATEDEVLVKQNALLSKALRTNAQRLLPFDIVEEAMSVAKQTLQKADAQDPDAAKRKLIDGFARLGVEPVDLEAYLGKSLNKPLVPAELADLRERWTALKEGETTWQEIMESAASTGSAEQQDELRKKKVSEAEAELQRQKAAAQNTAEGQPSESGNSGAPSDSAATQGSTQTATPGSRPKLQFGGGPKK